MTEIDELRSAKDNRMKVPVKKRGQAKIWVTRKGVRADRIGSAWLIRRFIGPQASFRFVMNDYVLKRGEIRFDMFEGDSRTQMTGVPLKRWSKLTASPQMRCSWFSQRSYMTLTLKDERYQRPETTGLARLINGMCLTVPSDAERPERGAIIFDSLYNGLARSGEAPKFVSFFTGYLTICSGRIQETFSGGDARRSEYGGSSANPAG